MTNIPVNVFFEAVEKGDAQSVQDYLSQDISLLEERTESDATALMIACRRNDAILASLLLEKGADVLASDDAGKNAIFYACEGAAPELVK